MTESVQPSPSYDSLEGSVHEACIYRRNGGCAVLVDAKVYVWGGEGAEQRQLPTDIPDDHDEEDDDEEDDDSDEEDIQDVWMVTILPPPRLKSAPFDVYDMHTCTWSRITTSGTMPLLGLGVYRHIAKIYLRVFFS